MNMNFSNNKKITDFFKSKNMAIGKANIDTFKVIEENIEVKND